jgi:prepilin-type N-terminal cleavage/methylation domain-containing protein
MEVVLTKRSHNGFTLIEMLAVMAIMMVMMAMMMVSFTDWGRGASMRSAVLSVKSHLVTTRQWAITHRVRTTFTYGNVTNTGALTGYYVVTNGVDGLIGSTNYLPKGVTNLTSGRITFTLDGSCAGGTANTIITLVKNNLTNQVSVYPLTGMVKLVE